MSFIPHSIEERALMLKAIGISDEEELFSMIPEELRLRQRLKIPGPLDEETIKRIPQGNFSKALFAGGGIYRHHIPAIVDMIASRQEIYTAYTPYQPEISQGTLQIIFEYQSMMASLTGMDVANASMYDGATALAEAVMMAVRAKDVKRILVARTVNPSYRAVLKTYMANFEVVIEEVPYDAGSGQIDLQALKDMSGNDSAFFIQNPNYFGIIEPMDEVSSVAKHTAFWGIVTGDAVSLGLLKKPGIWGCDVVSGDAQSFGNPTSGGGPMLGFMCVKKDNVRRMPGRIVGLTEDAAGNPAFCLTLSTREQHIRREKATSNICSNQALCATRSAIYLAAMGPAGLRTVAVQSARGARLLAEIFASKGYGALFSAPYFNEFVIKMSEEKVIELENAEITPGIQIQSCYPEMPEAVLVTVTEANSKEELRCLIENL
ncbi:MAG TPA: aminomethyl-transferring glycine dehydrogenase subunit GcvPA [Desulfomonilia bacterium]